VSEAGELRELLSRSAAVIAAAGTGGAGAGAVAAGVQVVQSVLDHASAAGFAGAALAELQAVRIEEALTEAKRVIGAQMMSPIDRRPRTDWFGAPPADHVPVLETLELTLIAAAESYERRKVKLLANLLAMLAFEPRISHAAGLYLIHTVRDLSYRQLVALGAVTEMSEGPPSPLTAELDYVTPPTTPLPPFAGWGPRAGQTTIVSASLGGEILDLIQRDLLRTSRDTGVPSRTAVVARDLRPTVSGRRIYALAVFGTHIPLADREATAREIIRLRDPVRDGPRPQR